MDQDKDSLTEQQRKQTVTTIILMKIGEYTEQLLSPPSAQRGRELQFTSPWPAPPLKTEPDGTWY